MAATPNSFNRCNVSPWRIGSREFNDAPEPIELTGVRQADRFLFAQLDATEDVDRRGRLFHDFMSVKFNLHEWTRHTGSARKGLRNSYLRFLRGWGFDSNSVEGAVVKGWVESRFGIPPSYHRGKMTGRYSEEHGPYVFDRVRGNRRTNGIDSQLDLMFEFCQYELNRRDPGRTHFDLFRGTEDAGEYEVLDRDGPRRLCVLLNNVCSLTANVDVAFEFGSTVWAVRVPAVKVVFFSGLFPDAILKGEDEYLAIGGEYWCERVL